MAMAMQLGFRRHSKQRLAVFSEFELSGLSNVSCGVHVLGFLNREMWILNSIAGFAISDVELQIFSLFQKCQMVKMLDFWATSHIGMNSN